MGMTIDYYFDEERLDITIDEDLDLTLSRQMFEVYENISKRLLTCVIDCSRVKRVFDSGHALLTLLIEKLKACQVRLIIIGDSEQIRFPTQSAAINLCVAS